MLTQTLALLARGLLRLHPPDRALTLLRAIAGVVPSLTSPEAVAREFLALGDSGSCLARSLAVAARAPETSVVIGVDPRRSGRFFAHAWVEWQGRPIPATVPDGEAVVRLPVLSPGRSS